MDIFENWLFLQTRSAKGENVVIRQGPLCKADKVAAWCLAAVWGLGGTIALGLAVAHQHWRLGLCAAGAVGMGALFGVCAARGRPLGCSFPRRTTQKQ
jgi:hypothetical protein